MKMFFTVLMTAAVFSLSSAVVYVNCKASGANNGTSWANAYTSFQTALENTASGNQIWVASGVYKPVKDINGNASPADPRAKTFTLRAGVPVYGGFAGTETSLDQRDFSKNVTVLSGDLAGDDTTDTKGVVLDWSQVVGNENCCNVVTEWNITCTMDGFTVTAGLGDKDYGACLPYGTGNGMLCAWGNTTLNNMVFQGNHGNLRPGGAVYFWEGTGSVTNSSFIGNDGSQGGALYLRTATVSVSNVLFRDNEARDPLGQSGTAAVSGGGLFASGTGNSITNSQFINNSAKNEAGGFYANNSMTVSNILFQGNTGKYGGGMWDEDGSVMTDLTFISNSAERGGGMVGRQLAATGIYTRLVFTDNTATLSGGGIYCEGASPIFNECVFSGNQSGESGGALWFYYGTPSLINTVIRSNSAEYGSALCSMFGQFTFTNTTVYGNSGSYLFYDWTGSGSTNIRNSIIWNNGGTVYSGDVPVNIRYSIVQGGWGGSGNLSVDPLFTDPANGDLSLQASSPAIDAGDNTITDPVLPSIDMAGNSRRTDISYIADTGLGTAPVTDIGAYERMFVLTAPANLTITRGTSSTQLSWTAVPGASSYKIYRSADPYGTFSLIDTVTSVTYTDDDVLTGAKYFYQVTAVSAK